MTSRWQRLAHLRATLHEQALGTLRSAQEATRDSERTIDALRYLIRDEGVERPVRATILMMLERATCAAVNLLEVAELVEERAAADVRARAVERRQMERMVELEGERQRRAARRKEQQRSDEWSGARWGRK